MDKIIVVTFDSEKNAFLGTAALDELHADAAITLYASAVIRKDADGKVAVVQESDKGPLGTAVGLLTGSLIGLLGGPVGMAFGAYVGSMGGIIYDLAKLGVNEDFLDDVGHDLVPGKVAVVAEVDEEWVTPLDARMTEAGGVVFRRVRSEALDAKIASDAATLRAEVAELESEHARANNKAKANLKAKIDTTKAKLHATQEKAKAAMEDARRETEAKIASLKKQAENATAETKAKIDKRIAELQDEHKRRMEKLGQAWELTKEAAAI